VVLAEDGPLVGDLRDAGVEVLVRPLAVVRRSLMNPRGITRIVAAFALDAGGLGRLARSRSVDIVHSNTSVTLGGAATARLAGVPHVWHVREIYAGFERWFASYRRFLLTADALPCVSAATAAQFAGHPRAGVIADGVPYPPRPVPREEARAVLGLPGDAFVAALLGRIAPWKGQGVLVRALARSDEATVALICGAPWPGDEHVRRAVEELAVSLGVASRTRLTGMVEPDLAFGAADVVVVPSTQPDPFPNSALEAAAAGCCVVGADHGGIPEIVEHGVTGVLVEPGSAHALAGALAGLRADRQRIARLGAAAAERVRTRFTRERMLAEVQDLYDRLLA